MDLLKIFFYFLMALFMISLFVQRFLSSQVWPGVPRVLAYLVVGFLHTFQPTL